MQEAQESVVELTPEAQAQMAPAEAPKPQQITRKQLGQLRRMHLTVQHSTVNACGHKFVADAMPARNCSDCWYAYFKTSVDLEALRDGLTMDGVDAMNSQYGVKYIQAFKRFLHEELTNGLHFAQPERDNSAETNAAELPSPVGIQGSTIAAPDVCSIEPKGPDGCACHGNTDVPFGVRPS